MAQARCVSCSQIFELKINKGGATLSPKICSGKCFINLVEKSERSVDVVKKLENKEKNGMRRSKLECRAENVFKRLNLKFEYEPYIIVLPFKGKSVYYLPDYYLPDYEVYLEAKGIWGPMAYRKCSLMKEVLPKNYYLLQESDLRRLMK